MVVVRPHDCFRCLGKDPERTYSIWQMSTSTRLVSDNIRGEFGQILEGNLVSLNQTHQEEEMLKGTQSDGQADHLSDYYGMNRTDVPHY